MFDQLSYLQKLGLTQYETRALMVLFSRTRATARTISRFAHVPYTKVYDVLARLRERDLIGFHPGTPRLYECKNPTHVVNSLIRRQEKELSVLVKLKEYQLREISRMDLKLDSFPEMHADVSLNL